jgi:hypothetical protein
MNGISGVNPAWAPKPVEPAGSIMPNTPANAPGGVSDVVEISTASALASKVRDLPDVRADLVARAKEEIAAGIYETPERIDGAVARLLDDLLPPELL